MGRIEAICISEKKGTVKHAIPECRCIKDFGLENDAHAGSGRQVSLLSKEKVAAFQEKLGDAMTLEAGCFGENLLVSGFDLAALPLGTRFSIGEVLLELMQIGKTCHAGCEISKITGECIMPREGVFAKVLQGGTIHQGDEIRILSRPSPESAGSRGQFRAAILTASDRSFHGVYEDKSGPMIKKIVEDFGYVITESVLLPDDQSQIEEALRRIADNDACDVIFTTGGTGFSARDCMPEATLAIAEKNVPGIAEAIRAYSMRITPRAMLSRAASAIRGKTLIINLPGSPKAVKECLEFLLPNLEHGLLILRGEADG